MPVSHILIADEEPRCRVPREGVHDLLSKPLCSRLGSGVS
jgi:hypothetical protein